METTPAIVFRTLKYSDTSLIVKLYTRSFGLISCMVRGARRKNAPVGTALLQPMNLLEVVVSHRQNKSFQTLREARILNHYRSIGTDVRKNALMLFINELLNMVIREEEPNPPLFGFLYDQLIELDETEKTSLFHLRMLTGLMRFLGFFPLANRSTVNCRFDMREGRFTQITGPEEEILDEETSRWLSYLIEPDGYPALLSGVTPRIRDQLLDALLRYYRMHLPGMHELKSLPVLKSLFS
ncbi:MAG: DNA repair protein RecO [Bacteroidales bacterium]